MFAIVAHWRLSLTRAIYLSDPSYVYVLLSALVFYYLKDTKMNNIAQFNATDYNNAIVEFSPVCVTVHGETATEKRLSVISQASSQALDFMVNATGKVGQMARANKSKEGLEGIARQAQNGNFKPLADAIAALTGASISIRNKAAFMALPDRFEDAKLDLKNGGYTFKDGVEKPSAKLRVIEQCLALINAVQSVSI